MKESPVDEPLLQSKDSDVSHRMDDDIPPNSVPLPLRDNHRDTNSVDETGSYTGGGAEEGVTGDNGERKRMGGTGLLRFFSSARLLCMVMVLDLMTMSVQIPSLPSVFESHGMDLGWQGWVASVHGMISFFVAPVLGGVSDSVGRVAMLQVSAVGSLLGALGSLYATDKWAFIAARSLPGLLKCSLPISQAYIVDVSEGAAERSKNLGMLGASFGVAFVLGPPLGGLAADHNASYPLVLAALLSLVLLGALRFVLPEPAAKKSKPKPGSINGNGAVGKSTSRLSLFRGPAGRQMAWGFHDRFWVVIAEGLYHTSLAPFLTKVLGFPAGRIGFLLSFMGLVSALTNAFLVGFLSRRFSERKLMPMALLILGTGWTMWSSVNETLPSVLAALTLAGVGGNVFQTVNKAAVAQHAPPELIGTVMGMSGAMETFGRTASGPLSGYLFKACGARRTSLVCAAAAFYVAFVLFCRGVAVRKGTPIVNAGKAEGRGSDGGSGWVGFDRDDGHSDLKSD